jgi:hypothetical protein
MPQQLLSFLLILLLSGCATRSHSVLYRVDGDAERVAVSYTNETGATEQRDIVGSWSTSFAAPTWRYVGVTAFNPTLTGSVRCRLYIDGVLVQEARSTGAWKAAVCGALAGVTTDD